MWIANLARHRPDNAGVIYVESSNPTSDCCYSNVMTFATVQISTVTVVILE